jgi:hypothetical protein
MPSGLEEIPPLLPGYGLPPESGYSHSQSQLGWVVFSSLRNRSSESTPKWSGSGRGSRHPEIAS